MSISVFVTIFLVAVPLSTEHLMARNGFVTSHLFMDLRNLPEAYSKSYLLPGLRPIATNVITEPPLVVNPNIKPSKARYDRSKDLKLKKSGSKKLSPPKRLYQLGKEELVISCNISTIMNPTNTRLVPPLTWLTAEGSKVKILHSSRGISTSNSGLTPQLMRDHLENSDSSIMIKHSVLEIVIERLFVDKSLNSLKLNGFSRDDINRMVDKAPWILAFDLSKCVPKLFSDLQSDLGLTSQQAVHVISHCPFLVAQYARYKGRDVCATAKALVEVGYSSVKLVDDIMRFPTILSCPPNRILGWQNLLAMFGIATAPGIFGKMLRKAPFMFYINPPRIDDDEENEVAELDDVDRMATTSDYVLREGLRVLQVLESLALSDLDKVFRTQPNILLQSSNEVKNRVLFFMSLYSDVLEVNASPERRRSGTNSFGKKREQRFNQERDSEKGKELEEFSEDSRSTNLSLSGGFDSAFDVSQGDDDSRSQDDDAFDSNATILSATNNRNYIIEQPPDADVDISQKVQGENANMEYNNDMFDSSQASQVRAKLMVSELLLTYPAVLSNESRQMRAIASALRSVGLRRVEIGRLVRRHPQVLTWDPLETQLVLSLLRFRCALKKADILILLMKAPEVLRIPLAELEAKMDYLFDSLDGPGTVLRQCPGYLLLDLGTHIRPRAEFLRALGYPPLSKGLPFLVYSTSEELARFVKAELDLFLRFRDAFIAKVVNKSPSTTSPESKSATTLSQQSRIIEASPGRENDMSGNSVDRDELFNLSSQITLDTTRNKCFDAPATIKPKLKKAISGLEDETTQRPFLDECIELDF